MVKGPLPYGVRGVRPIFLGRVMWRSIFTTQFQETPVFRLILTKFNQISVNLTKLSLNLVKLS